MGREFCESKKFYDRRKSGKGVSRDSPKSVVPTPDYPSESPEDLSSLEIYYHTLDPLRLSGGHLYFTKEKKKALKIILIYSSPGFTYRTTVQVQIPLPPMGKLKPNKERELNHGSPNSWWLNQCPDTHVPSMQHSEYKVYLGVLMKIERGAEVWCPVFPLLLQTLF